MDCAPISPPGESEKKSLGHLRSFGTRGTEVFALPTLLISPVLIILLALHSSNCQSQAVPEMPPSLQCQGGGVEGAANPRSGEGGVECGRNHKRVLEYRFLSWEGGSGELTFDHAVGMFSPYSLVVGGKREVRLKDLETRCGWVFCFEEEGLRTRCHQVLKSPLRRGMLVEGWGNWGCCPMW